jgi:hypothetical protein
MLGKKKEEEKREESENLRYEIIEYPADVYELVYKSKLFDDIPAELNPDIERKIRATVYKNKDGNIISIRLEKIRLHKDTGWIIEEGKFLSTLEVLLLSRIFRGDRNE